MEQGAGEEQRRWGRFTARGGEAVEADVRGLVGRIAEKAQEALVPGQFRALVMLGGYGRGEGGVEVAGGGEKPHNNLDFLLITRGLGAGEMARLKGELDDRLVPMGHREGIGIDLGVIDADKLRRSPCLVMWYDMRWGHKTILGDADFVPSLERFSLERVLDWDVRNLMVNRGTLFLFNDLLLDHGGLDLERRRLIVKHAVKGVIGYGDALLFFLGDYDWSYAEKQRRMRRRDDVPEDFRRLYDEAVEFRFRPRYDAYLERDPGEWMAEWRRDLAAVHLRCEAARLGAPGLDWANYAETAFGRAFVEGGWAPRSLAKKGLNLLRAAPAPAGLGGRAALGYRCGGEHGLFPLVFPAIAYGLEDPGYRELARDSLGAASTALPDLRRAYMRLWGRVSDINFPTVLRKLGISLEDGP